MKHFSMLRFLIVAAVGLALPTLRLTAQQLDNPVTYSVSFQASWVTGTGGFNGSVVDGTSATISFGAGSGNALDTVKTAKLVPNKEYLVSVSVPAVPGQPGNTGHLKFSPPGPGMAVYLNDVAVTSMDFVVGNSTFKLRVASNSPLDGSAGNLRAGEASPIAPDKAIWYVGLGHFRNGQSAGAIGFRRQDFSGNFFTPAALYYDAIDPTEVDVIYSSGVLRQILAREVLADIQTVTSSKYKIDIYPRPATPSLTGGLYDLTSQTAFVTYTVESIANGVKITRVEDGVTWETSLELSSTTWTRKDWHRLSAATPSTLTTVYSPATLGTVSQTGPASGLTGDTALNWTKTFTSYDWGSELTETKVGATLTTSYNYYTSTTTDTFLGKIKSQLNPSGGWVKYDYYDTTGSSGTAGSLKRVYRPWQDGPTSPDSATATNSVVTTYSYEDTHNWPAEVSTTAPDGTLSKTTWSYATSTALNGEAVTATTRTDYTSSTETLVTTSKAYDTAATSAYYRDMPVSTAYPNGSKDSYAYFEGTWDASGTSFTASLTGGDRYVLAFHGRSSAGTPAGTSVNSWIMSSITRDMDNLYLVAGLSTVSGTVTDVKGRVVFVGEYLYTSTGGGTLTLIAGTTYAYDSHGRVVEEADAMRTSAKTTRTYSAATTGTYAYSVESTAADGVITRADYDELLRLVLTTNGKSGGTAYPATTTQTVYDAANRPVATYGPTTVRYFYDVAGRLTSRRDMSPSDAWNAAQGSLVTSYDYSTVRRVTTTSPTGATRVEDAYLDGRPKSVTGTGLAPTYIDYAVTATGPLTTRKNGSTKANGWVEIQADWLGRTRTQSAPAYAWDATTAPNNIIDTSFTYDASTGLLSKQMTTNRANSTKLTPDRLFVYDASGRLTSEGLDVNADGSLTTSSNDRITAYDHSFAQDTAGWRSIDKTSTYATAGSSTATQLSEVRTRLTGFATGVVAETVAIDVNGRTTTSTTSVDPTLKQTKVQATTDGISNAVYQKTTNGYDFEAQTTTGERVSKDYDSLGRLSHVYSRWDGTAYGATDTYGYNANTTFVSGTTIAGISTSYSYAWDSTAKTRTVSTTDAAGNVSYVLYNAMDLPVHTGGTGASATALGYDAVGRRTSLTTYRGGQYDETNWPSTGGDTTTWTPDPATSLVTRKTFADANHVDYTYTALGQLATRTWARGTSATYTYYDGSFTASTDVSHRTQELCSVTYSDSTPGVTYTYKRSGLPAGVADVTGSRTFGYDTTNPLRMTTETLGSFYSSKVRNFQYDSYGTNKGFILGTNELTQTVSFSDSTGLISTLDAASNGNGARTFTYGYKDYSGRVDTLTTGSYVASYDYDATSAARRSRVEGKWGATSVTRFDLAYDNRGLLQSAKQSGTAFADYSSGTSYSSVYNYHAYDGRGELNTTAMYRNTPPPSGAPASTDELPGRRFEYRYDGTGNRTTAGSTGLASGGDDEYTANSLNQYSAKENNAVRILGTAAASANAGAQSTSGGVLTVNKKDRSFAADVLPLNNASGPAKGDVTVFSASLGTGANGSDLVGSQTRSWTIAKQLQAFTYDADGNMTSDGMWTYQYDAENRLIRMASTTGPNSAVSAGLPNRVLEFKYDFMGRRVQKRSNNVTAGTDVYTGYLYDGWNVVAEYTVNNPTSAPACGTMLRSFAWGLDIASSTNATGGVGALLQITDQASGKSYFPTYDGNGNVSTLIDASDGSRAATYEYSPYGELLRAEGTYAASNPFRFSTKWTDTESGFSYYGLRYYSPCLGRFINRDPIEESGGLNLYGFCGNNGINATDTLGMYTDEERAYLNAWYKSRYDNAHQAGTFSGIDQMDALMYGGEDHTLYSVNGQPVGTIGEYMGERNLDFRPKGRGNTRAYTRNGQNYVVSNSPDFDATGLKVVSRGSAATGSNRRFVVRASPYLDKPSGNEYGSSDITWDENGNVLYAFEYRRHRVLSWWDAPNRGVTTIGGAQFDANGNMIQQKSTAQPCIMCHGVSAAGFSGNVNDFSAYLPGTGPNARQGYSTLVTLSANATPLIISGGFAAVDWGVALLQSPATPRLVFQGATLFTNGGDVGATLLEGPMFEDIPIMTREITTLETVAPASGPPPPLPPPAPYPYPVPMPKF